MSDSNDPNGPAPDGSGPASPAGPAAAPTGQPAAYPPPAQGAPPAYGPPPTYPAAPPAYNAAPPAYGAASGAPAYGAYQAPAKTNTLAIVSLISAIAGFTFVPFIGSIVAVVTGHMSLSQIKRSGEGGHGLGLTGTILGWVGLALALLGIIFIAALIPFFVANYPEMRINM